MRRIDARVVAIIAALLSAPIHVALAADDQAAAPASNHGSTFAEAVKRDTRAAGVAIKNGAHRVAVASKGVAHEIAAAAKRGAAATRDAFH